MSDEPKPVGRFDWERLVDRAEMPKHLKALAYVMAHYANRDGSNVRVGRKLLADILDDSEHTVSTNREALVSMGFLTLIKRGGGRGGDGTVNVYRLTDPGPGFLIFRLDPDGNREIPRKVGKRPRKAIEVKSASPDSPVDNSDPGDLEPGNEVKPGSHENGFHVKRANDWSEAHFPLPVVTRTPLLLPLTDPPQFVAAQPVDNPKAVNGIDPPRAPPVAAVPKPRPQPRKRRKR